MKNLFYAILLVRSVDKPVRNNNYLQNKFKLLWVSTQLFQFWF